MKRRTLLLGGAGLATLTASGLGAWRITAADDAAVTDSGFAVTRTEARWRMLLTDVEYEVLREMGTEKPYSSPLNAEDRAGTYLCKGCALPVYASDTKFESGTGWPSFTEALPDAVGTKDDDTLFATRTEVHCRRCGSHLGHIFDDGPPPTGKRHCLNGLALQFLPA